MTQLALSEASLIVIVAAETILLALLSLLVAGLLRSHVEILRRLGTERESGDAHRDEFDPRIASPSDKELGAPAAELVGATLSGDAYKRAFPEGGPNTLLAFLSSGCSLCEEFWGAFRMGGLTKLPEATELIIVTKDTTHESPTKLHALAPEGITVIMSSAAWNDFAVPVAPYFIFVDGPTGGVRLSRGS